MSASVTFLKCLIPRLLLSVIFTWSGFLGSGGDPDAYHILGKYLKETLLDPVHADLDAILETEGYEELGKTFEIHAVRVEQIRKPESVQHILNDVMPILLLHALGYCVWDSPFVFVLLNSLLSAFAITRAVSAFQLNGAQSAWLIFNPVSIFFAATHYKESIAESLVIVFTTALHAQNRPIRALFWILLMVAFRVSFSGFLAAFYVFRYTGIGRMRPMIFFGGVLLAFAVLPPFFIVDDAELEGAGGVYALVHANEYTMKLLGPLLGLLLPTPFHLVLADWSVDAGTLFLTIYGIFYYLVGLGWVIHWRYATRSAEANRLVNTTLFVALLIGYLFVGASGVKDRYFAAFLPVMILALIQMLVLKAEERAEEDSCGSAPAETNPNS